MDEDKQLQKLQAILELVNKDYVDPEEFVQAFEAVLSAIAIIKENTEDSLDLVEEKIGETEKALGQVISAFHKRIDGVDKSLGEKGKIEKEIRGAIKSLETRLSASIAEVKSSFPRVDLSEIEEDIKKLKNVKIPVPKEETPDETIEKINRGKKKIKKERIEGLDDIERMARANSAQGYPGVSETKVSEMIRKSRFVEGNSDNSTVPKLTVSATEPQNPKLYDLWMDIS